MTLQPAERQFFAGEQPLGFILFGRNIQSPEQVARLCSELRDAVGRNAPILIDQEGGRVQRLGPPHWRQWHPPLDQMARAGDLETAARASFLRYRLIAHELLALGIDVDCVPTADIARPDTHPFLRNRCFGEDTASVVTGARAAAEGLMAGGVLPVMKHIPGHGRSRADSHKDLPVVEATAETLRETDFAPFQSLADLPMGMTGHLKYLAFDSERPATQSPRMVSLIREEIGFDGLLMTDDLSMEALDGTVGARAAAAIAAGCDIALHCNGVLDEMRSVVAASGALEAPALARANSALDRRPEPQEIDIPAVEAELHDLLDGEVYG
ncbi:glycoside hydrolase family 3 N-terminal domain-containing protein [Tropicimonas sp. TH_r6]|uniref:glycoside hydrolase family 3 N-terminal domain-containing protein n=1 Tax=Tropicimonas sp. TH_r6 TaxID=3082085 RepID=UPI002952FA92|nr:glycoside hydrolase family 3 N-terminal domain-containing protein [Tropicimonas sp. TH_r6]MDV7144426.1 glycoside hydrolase family 3 N-terminal domain-containing protein [Tropicimonas sp. TH_r6]